MYVVLFLFIIAAVVLSALKSKGNGGKSAKAFNFARKSPFLRQDEIHLYERLAAALKDAYVFPQVAMSAFVQHKGKSQVARNFFAQKYVDYLVCDRKSMRPLYVIELDGASHGSARAQKRDSQKNDVLASAGIPIKRYTSKDVEFTIILRDYASVVSPPPVQGESPSPALNAT
ncbi:hypothetical protein AWV80_17535 [Cupriavidus sp. UYMU48A]|nr:hypothetical protein AWV80_17535 [Cupriavidus sp. UYMU48A]